MPPFDKAQQEVIAIRNGVHLVLAPPGCGKTAILTERVRNAIAEGTDPGQMLCLTFTNRAARGMEERIQNAGINTQDRVFIGNTHRFCGKFLFDNNLLGHASEIIDEDTSSSVIEEIFNAVSTPADNNTIRKATNRIYYLQHLLRQFECGMPNNTVIYTAHHASDGLRDLCMELKLPAKRNSILEIYNNPEKILTDEVRNSPFHSTTISYLELAKRYAEYKKAHNLIDFDDLLLNLYDYLLHDPEHRRYSWIQIDEIQDLNPLQIAIINELTAPEGTTIYLGDEQQAIFSFMGADTSTLRNIIDRCGKNIHRLENNYRSPSYIIEMLNEYATKNLDTLPEFLPKPANTVNHEKGDLSIVYSRDTVTLPKMVAGITRKLPADERTAIIVATNAAADEVSNALKDIPHFKISGQDYFCTVETATLLSIAALVSNDCSLIAWAKLFLGIRISNDFKSARRTAINLFASGIIPSDLIRFESGSTISHFRESFNNGTTPMVIFDTETSGLDTHTDDIIQIAAIKTLNGEIIDRQNIFLKTDKKIPEMLGDIPNPLIEEYSRQELLERREGLLRFLEFTKGCTLVGHNVCFDYSILNHNLRRDCGIDSIDDYITGHTFDTLQISRLLFPGLISFKLKDILSHFELEGKNSHLADDDILATFSLCKHIATEISKPEFEQKHLSALEKTTGLRKILCEKIGPLYNDALSIRDNAYGIAPLADFIYELSRKLITDLHINLNRKKTSYFIKYLKMTSAGTPQGLREELEKRMADLQTLREADLCDNKIVTENIFVTTLHKAKGLEFENVIIYNVTDGIYPFFYSNTQKEKDEDARKLYVALSRARKRLLLTVPHKKIVLARNGNTYAFDTEISPFIGRISEMFDIING